MKKLSVFFLLLIACILTATSCDCIVHKMGDWQESIAPTCTEAGVLERVCQKCGLVEEKHTETALKGFHSFGEWECEVAATCTVGGVDIKRCKDCIAVERKDTSPLSEGGHTFGSWTIILQPTCDAYGSKSRKCSVCSHEEIGRVDKLPIAYRLTLTDNGKGEGAVINLPADGKYDISALTKPGYELIGWYTESGDSFATVGILSSDVTVTPRWEILLTTTFDELKERLQDGADKIIVANDITLTDTIFVTSKTILTTNGDYTLTRAQDFFGDLFVLGETADGKNVLLDGAPAHLILECEGENSLVIDGNKENLTGTVVGSAFFLDNGSKLDLYDGVTITNHKKLGNDRILDEKKYTFTSRVSVGGAVAIIYNGAFSVFGGSISNNETNTNDSGNTAEADRIEGYNYSAYGGAIYNQSAFNMYGGVIEGNTGCRGGAIYNSRILTIRGGSFISNTAGVHGGAIYQPSSQVANIFLGTEGSKEHGVLFENNEATKSGGAIYSGHQCALLIFGDTAFVGNKANRSYGGAIYTNSDTVIKYASFEKNLSALKGGAIYFSYADSGKDPRAFVIESAIFDSNESSRGGAIGISSNTTANEQATLTLGEVVFKNNRAFKTEDYSPTFIDNYEREGVTKKNHGSGGAIHCSGMSTIILDGYFDFDSNVAENMGGALYLTVSSTLKATNGTFRNNTSERYAGATAFLDGSKAFFKDTSFTANSSAKGGAISLHSGSTATVNGISAIQNAAKSGGFMYAASAKVTINAVGGYTNAFTGNSATGSGGVFNMQGSVLHILGENENAINLSSNSAGSSGGAIYLCSSSSDDESGNSIVTRSELILRNVLLEYNTVDKSSSYGGGGVYASGTNAEFYFVSFEHNSAVSGGAFSAYTGTVINAEKLLLNANSAYKYGGAVYTSRSELTLTDTVATNNGAGTDETADYVGTGGVFYINTISTLNLNTITATDNTASLNGGMLYLGHTATATVTGDAKISNNSAQNGSGGAIYLYTKSTFTSTANTDGSTATFSQNTALENGGAIFTVEDSGELNVNYANFTGNSAGAMGGAIATRSSAKTVLSNITFLENDAGTTGGALYVAYSKAEITDTTFTKNSATGNGGAIYFTTARSEESTVAECKFENNVSLANGGAVYSTKSETKLADALFEGNTAENGGAIYATSSSVITLESPNFKSNCATGKYGGGALYISTSVSAAFNDITLTDNTSSAAGGAMYIGGSASVTANGIAASGNSAKTYGGAIVMYSGSLNLVSGSDITKNRFENNIAESDGGAIYAEAIIDGKSISTTLDVTDAVFKNNLAADGDAIYTSASSDTEEYTSTLSVYIKSSTFTVDKATLPEETSLTSYLHISRADAAEITSSRFESNSATTYGGAIYATRSALNLISCVFDGNSSKNTGGALYMSYGSVHAEDTEFTDNFSTAASYGGGALYVTTVNTETSTFKNCTFKGNSSQKGGGAIFNTKSDLEFTDCIFEENTAAYGGALYCTTDSKTSVTNTSFTANEATSSSGGAIFVSTRGEATLTDITLTSNKAAENAGAIYAGGTANVTLRGVVAKDNSAAENGGVIALSNATVNVMGGVVTTDNLFVNNVATSGGVIYVASDGVYNDIGSTYSENTAEYGGAIYAIGEVETSSDGVVTNIIATVILNDASFIKNSSKYEESTTAEDGTAEINVKYGKGGAIFIAENAELNYTANEALTFIDGVADVTYTGPKFDSNIAANGAAIYISAIETSGANYGVVNICGATFTNHETTGSGSTIYANGVLNTNKSVFYNNTSDGQGGAVYVTKNYTDSESLFIANSATGQAGAIQTGANAVLEKTQFISNKSTANRAGALLATGGEIKASGVRFEANEALGNSGNGGAMVITGAKASVFENCEFINNTSNNRAGAIYLHNSDPMTTYSCSFSDNDAANGGAIYMTSSSTYIDGSADDLTLGSSFTQNNASSSGGAIYLAGEAHIYGTVLNANAAGTNGGAIYTSAILSATSCNFEGNTATELAGAIYAKKNVTVSDTLFKNNTAVSGGAIYVDSAATLTSNGISASGNSATENGGVIAIIGGTVTVGDGTAITTNLFENNTVAENGGVFYVADGSSLTVNNMTAKGNGAKNGGVISSPEGTVTITGKAHFENNTATGNGGAVHMYPAASITTTLTANEIFAIGNSAKSGGFAFVSGADQTAVTTITVTTLTANENSASSTGNAGGAIYLYNCGEAIIGTLTATNNTANGLGGAFLMSGKGKATIDNVLEASGNRGSKGGFIYITTTGTTLTIKDGTLGNNTATAGESAGSTMWCNSKGAKIYFGTRVTYEDGSLLGKDWTTDKIIEYTEE